MATRPDEFDFNEPTQPEPRQRRRRPKVIGPPLTRKTIIIICVAAVVGWLLLIFLLGVFDPGFNAPSLQQAYFDANYNQIPIKEGKIYSGEIFVIDRGGKDGAITITGTWPNSENQGVSLHWKGSMKDAPLVGRTIRFRCKIVDGAPELLSWR